MLLAPSIAGIKVAAVLVAGSTVPLWSGSCTFAVDAIKEAGCGDLTVMSHASFGRKTPNGVLDYYHSYYSCSNREEPLISVAVRGQGCVVVESFDAAIEAVDGMIAAKQFLQGKQQ